MTASSLVPLLGEATAQAWAGGKLYVKKSRHAPFEPRPKTTVEDTLESRNPCINQVA